MKSINPLGRLLPQVWSVSILALLLLLFLSLPVLAERHYVNHSWQGKTLVVATSEGDIHLSALNHSALEVLYKTAAQPLQPSFTIAKTAGYISPHLDNEKKYLNFKAGKISARIHKQPVSIDFFYQGEKLVEEELGYRQTETGHGFRFKLNDTEALLGTGSRVAGMNRRGHKFPLYNKAHYGYGLESEQMYYSVPGVLSSNHYMLMFDNPAKGEVDLGKADANILEFKAVAGRSAYLVVGGDNYKDILKNYTQFSGRQPLPPRWAFGNYASRMGYHTEAEARQVVDKFRQLDIPLDAIVLDLFWFGPDIKGHMGNLAWDKNAFPQPEKMIADFKRQGVKTVLITEPFILSSSKRWQEAIDENVLAKKPSGEVKDFDFYFGNTGIIDVFDPKAQKWFWDIHKGLIEQGVEGLWGDLGEPEVHPSDTIHQAGSADEIHNAYGHQWAKMIHQNFTKDFPNKRLMLLMRSGFSGSQRFGMIPWSGDVSRSWDGLKPQVELAVQMGLMGLAYSHSDLGGFAGGESFDAELYTRWLQYGAFQPLFRPHGQEHIAPEPIFHDVKTQAIVRRFIKLRYRLLPYLYTMAWQNSQTGVPLARPLFFSDENNLQLIDDSSAYLWGDNFLISPVVEPGKKQQQINLPKGKWFNFWNDNIYSGGKKLLLPLTLETIPVLLKAGSFVPMLSRDIVSTRDYSSKDLDLHYYHHPDVATATGQMYEDDGASPNAFKHKKYELLNFSAQYQGRKLSISLDNKEHQYPGRPEQRNIRLIIHNWPRSNTRVTVAGARLSAEKISHDKDKKLLLLSLPLADKKKIITIK